MTCALEVLTNRWKTVALLAAALLAVVALVACSDDDADATSTTEATAEATTDATTEATTDATTEATTDATTDAGTETSTETTSTSAAIELVDVWARATAGNPGENSAIYGTIINNTEQDDVLVAVEVDQDIASGTEVHETVQVGDNMRMQEIPGGLPVAASATATLQPGGFHVMLMEVVSQLMPGQMLPVTFVFEHSGRVDVLVEVREMTAGTGSSGMMGSGN